MGAAKLLEIQLSYISFMVFGKDKLCKAINFLVKIKLFILPLPSQNRETITRKAQQVFHTGETASRV
jgi:hypothetical protein